MGGALVIGVIHGSIYALLAVGIVLVYKGSRVINFAQAEIGGFGLYLAVVFIERQNMPYIVGALLVVAICAAIGWSFDVVVARRLADSSRLTLTVATIGLMLLMYGIQLIRLGQNPYPLRGPIAGQGVEIFGWFVSPTNFVSFVVLGVLAAGLAWFFRSTDFGLGVLAASSDQSATRLMGIPVKRISAFTWAAAGALSGIAALLIAPVIGTVSAGRMTTLFVHALAAAMLGGLGSVSGAFVGGLTIGIMESLIAENIGSDAQVVGSMLVILGMLIVRPQGLFMKAARA